MENICKCTHHKVVPMCIALIGLVILLGGINVLTSSFVDFAWPTLLIVIGLTKLIGPGCKCC